MLDHTAYRKPDALTGYLVVTQNLITRLGNRAVYPAGGDAANSLANQSRH